MKCKYCKRELAENSIYCNWCGKKQFSSKGEINVPKARQLPSGKWFIQLRSGGQSVSITEDTEEACVLKAKATKAGLIERRRSVPSIKLSDAIDKYISTRSGILSPSTKRGYQMIKLHRFKSLMERKLKSIDEAVLKNAVNNEISTCSPKTLKNAYGLISAVLFEFTGNRYNIKLPNITPKEKAYLTASQIPTFLKAIKNTNIEIPCLLGLMSCRCSEIYGLTKENIDLERRIITIKETVVRDENNKLVKKATTKNISSTRKIPIIDRLYTLLTNCINNNEPLVSITYTALYKKINRICSNNSLPLIGVHGLRHSFASLGYHLSIPEKYLMEIGGWEDDKTMRNIYTHIAREDINHYEGAMLDFYNNVG